MNYRSWLALLTITGCNLVVSFEPPDGETPAQCNDGIDNEGDGVADCADSDCAQEANCATAEICDNKIDDDGDGLPDCADLDCVKELSCAPSPEICDNQADDDGDKAADCADADCASAPNCAGNRAPIGGDDKFDAIPGLNGSEDQALLISKALLLANDQDPDGDTLSISSASIPQGAKLSDLGDVYELKPDLNVNGVIRFSYSIDDGKGGSGSAAVEAFFAPVNDAPQAAGLTISLNEDETVSVLLDAFDPEGDPLSFSIVDGPSFGQVSGIAPDLVYTPDLHANGLDSFSFTVSDGVAAPVGPVVVTLEVLPVNDPPSAADDTGFSTSQGKPISIPVGALLGNDSDEDNAAQVSIVAVAPGVGGVAVLDVVGGQVVFTPDADFLGDASFRYTLSDTLASDTASVAVSVVALCGDGLRGGAEACDDGNSTGGDGCSSLCQGEAGFSCVGAPSVCAPVCGDGLALGGEFCDDGNTQSGDGCSSLCQSEVGFACSGAPSICASVCGDGFVRGGEACDDGNNLPGDGCNAACVVEFCGDGLVNNGEACDDGNSAGGDGCNAFCVVEFCGDGVVNNVGEACDDGNNTNNDGCNAACVVEFCGDGIQQANEACDDGNTSNGDGCNATCGAELGFACSGAPSVCAAVCGDGFVRGAEVCDDGNLASGDGCSSGCQGETGFECEGSPSICAAVCGDGFVRGAEACDDGNNLPGDGCNAACVVEFCGDGLVNNGEACDDGNSAGGDGCNAACVVEFCGDGLINNGGEACDDGNNLPGDGCNAACVVEFCGDGLVNNGGEACDDGNTQSGDGCDAVCGVESGFACVGASSVCTAVCGDGLVRGAEGCDDGNTTNTDGCSSVCQGEAGFVCAGSPSVCATVCGDGFVRGAESCDDGNTQSGDGCDAVCAVEGGFGCAGSPSVCAAVCGDGLLLGGESCDDGNTQSGDGCDAACAVEAGFVCAGTPSVCAQTCGNGNLDAGEACDDGNTQSGDGCSAACALEVCGDGVVNNAAEACDDGNTQSGDGCRANCTLEVCGDNILDPQEACDDGNTQSGDGCDAVCVDEFCGDGITNDLAETPPLSVEYVWLAMSCNGPQNIRFSSNGALVLETEGNPGTCTCTPGIRSQTVTDPAALAAFTNGPNGFSVDFNNGIGSAFLAWAVVRVSTVTGTQEFVLFDFGAPGDAENRNPDLCASGFTDSPLTNTVENVVLLAQETCDDSNAAPGDGCSDFCQIEVCGDGAINNNGTEQCDDGNTQSGDGCDENCFLPICGDGLFDAATEGCDDGNNVSLDGCSDVCALEVCGDGVLQGSEECDDGNLNNGDGCNAICNVETVCGNSILEAGELCDDGNAAPGDGCRADCNGLELCGDGLADFLAGEECDDGNLSDGDGCSSVCVLENRAVDAAPQLVSANLNCNTTTSDTGRKVSSDALGNFYVAMKCDGQVFVAVSNDLSQTYSAPINVGITGVSEVAIEGGPANTAYLAAIAGGQLLFSRSIDAGLTWSAPVSLGNFSDNEVSIDSIDDEVYIAASNGQMNIFRNGARGAGAFTQTALTQANVFHEVIVNKINGDVFSCSDDPSLHIRRSTDDAATFANETNPIGTDFFSDWAGGNGFLYVVGTGGDSDDIEVIPMENASTASEVFALPTMNTSNARAIDADALGNAYVVSQLDNGQVQLDRMVFGATSIDAADVRGFGTGTFPGVAALPSNDGAVVVFTVGSQVFVAVEVY